MQSDFRKCFNANGFQRFRLAGRLQPCIEHTSATCSRCNIDIHAEMRNCAKTHWFLNKSVSGPGPQTRILHQSRCCWKATLYHLTPIHFSNNAKNQCILTILAYGSVQHMHRSHIYNAAYEMRKCRYFSNTCAICAFLLNPPKGGHPGRRPGIICQMGGSCRRLPARSQIGPKSARFGIRRVESSSATATPAATATAIT